MMQPAAAPTPRHLPPGRPDALLARTGPFPRPGLAPARKARGAGHASANRRGARRAGLLAVLLALALLLAQPARPQSPPGERDADLCLAAAHRAAALEDVPLDWLLAIALVESGRDTGAGLRPWPWAIHTLGQGHWDADRAQARARAQAVVDAGTRNIDLGCFQINYHWHGAQFPSIDAMLDPQENARYAARLLRGHHDRLGSWALAAGAYHSATPARAEVYLARVLSRLGQTPLPGSSPRTRPAPVAIPALPAPPGGIALALARPVQPFIAASQP